MPDHDESHNEPGADRGKVIEFLRKEAFDVRDCFTRYSVYMFMASAALEVAIARIVLENPNKYLYVGLFGFFPAMFLFLVLSMGAHKYGTSDKILGYELHLQRTGHYLEDDLCHQLMRTVEWEEAMRAWRFVVPTLWAKIYWPAGSFSRRFFWIFIEREIISEIKKRIDENENNPNNDLRRSVWFDRYESLKLLTGDDYKGVTYNAGGYLKTVIFIFSVSILLCLTMPTFVAVQSYYDLLPVGSGKSAAHAPAVNVLVLIFYAITVIVMLGAWLNIYCRINILESGLLSIHTCGIMWEATVLAHLHALVELFFDRNAAERSMHGYTQLMAKYAVQISNSVTDIHAWIGEKRKSLNDKENIARPPVRSCRCQ